jgi:hypothetical protein
VGGLPGGAPLLLPFSTSLDFASLRAAFFADRLPGAAPLLLPFSTSLGFASLRAAFGRLR